MSECSNQISSVGFKPLLKTIKTHLHELKLLELNISSNNIRIDNSYEDFFDLSGLIDLKSLDLNLGYNEISPDFLAVMFKSIGAATTVTKLAINLECTKITPMHFAKAAR